MQYQQLTVDELIEAGLKTSYMRDDTHQAMSETCVNAPYTCDDKTRKALEAVYNTINETTQACMRIFHKPSRKADEYNHWGGLWGLRGLLPRPDSKYGAISDGKYDNSTTPSETAASHTASHMQSPASC